MSRIVLILVIISVSISGQRILTPPNNFTGIVGGSAEFKCHVELDVYQTVMSWEFNNDPVYIYQYGAIEYPKDPPGKYIVTKIGNTFTLSVKDLGHSDVGWYKCVVVSIEKSALLLVLEKPQIDSSNDNFKEGSIQHYTCKAWYTGPSKKDMAPLQYPQLRLYLDGQLLDGSTEEIIDSSGKYQFTQAHKVTLEGSMNGKVLTCDIGTSSPLMHVNDTTKMVVQYSVRNVNYTPSKGQYEVGEVINCTADGSPDPHFLWDDIVNIGNYLDGQLLNITKQMVGENHWRCTATNDFGGRSYPKFVLAAFDVVVPIQIDTANSDFWKIALGVIISIFLIMIIGCPVAVFIWYRFSGQIFTNFSADRKKASSPNKGKFNSTRRPSHNGYDTNVTPLIDRQGEINAKRPTLNERIQYKMGYIAQGDFAKVDSVAEGLAWSYFLNYINLIGLTMGDRIREFENSHASARGLIPTKLFILLPSSCFSFPKLQDADPAITNEGSLEPYNHQIAGNERKYETIVHKIEAKRKTYYACVEYCTPVVALYEMRVKGVISFPPEEMKAQLHVFYQLLETILEHPYFPQFCKDIQLVGYNDEDSTSLSHILVNQIENCLGVNNY